MTIEYTIPERARTRAPYARQCRPAPPHALPPYLSDKPLGRVVKRSVRVGNLRTSVSIEQEFWSGLKEIARLHRVPIYQLLADIADEAGPNLSSAIRVTVFKHFYQRAAKAV